MLFVDLKISAFTSPVLPSRNEIEAFPNGNTPSFTTITLEDEFRKTDLLSGWITGLSLLQETTNADIKIARLVLLKRDLKFFNLVLS